MGEGSRKGCEGLGLSSLQGEEGKGEASPGGKEETPAIDGSGRYWRENEGGENGGE
jgi:hypothetical protein